MAEQIRSFWSHLCGIFGAIFGMIAGGTLVTIERAGAFPAYTCNTQSQWKKSVIDHAIVWKCTGGGRNQCMLLDSGTQYCGAGYSGSCYTTSTFPRTYAYFAGCEDGYYSPNGWGVSLDKINQADAGVLLTAMTSAYASSATGALPGCSREQVHGGSETCQYCGAFYSTSAGKLMNGPTASTYYDSGVHSGLCVKCPTYGEYEASGSLNASTYAKSVSSCFMSANTERNDAVEHDGNATGNFVWTQSCMYSGSEPEPNPWADCEAMNGSGNCTITLDDRGTNSIEVIKVVRSVTGLGLKEAKAIVDSAPTTIIEDFSCTAANCYKPYFEEEGARITITQDSSSSGGGTTGGNIAGLPRCESMKATGDCSIMLDDAGANKIPVIKIVQSITGLGLAESRNIVNSAPVMVIEDFSCEAAECYKEIFDENNADVTITEY